MKKILSSLAIVLAAATFGQTAQRISSIDRSVVPTPQPNPELKIAIPEVVTLENGMKLIVVENHKLPRVSFQFYVDYPVETERYKAGLGSVFGEMMGCGTTNNPKDEIDRKIDYMGASLFTHQRGLFATSLKKHTPQLLSIVSEVIKSPAFPADEFDRIVKQNLSALESAKSEPNSMVQNVSSVVNFGKAHPYGEVMTEKTLDKISLEDIQAYYKKCFVPNLSYLVVVGDVTPQEAKEWATTYFGDWKGGVSPKPMSFELPAPTGNQVYFVNKDGAVQSVVQITHTVDLKPGHPDELKLKVLNRILGGGGFSARLFANLREDKAYTYGAYSSISSSRVTGEFTAGGSFRNEVTDSAITEMIKEIKRIVSEPVLATELDMAKKAMTGEFARSLESPQTLANFALDMALNKLSADYYTNYLKRLEAITISDLTTVAQKYLRPDNMNIVVVGNQEIADKLITFDSNHELTYKDNYGEDKIPLKPVPQGITAKMVVENYTLRCLNAMSVTEIPEKLKKIGYIKITASGSTQIQGMDITIEMLQYRANTNKSAMQIKIVTPMGPQVARKEWFDGEKGGSFTMGGEGLKTIEGDELEMKKHPSFPFEQMHYATNKSIELSLPGIEEIDGKDYYKVKIVDQTAPDELKYEYYSLETKMLSMTETITKDAEGNVSSATVTFDDYKDVNGILLSHTSKMNMGELSVVFSATEVIVKKKGKTGAFVGDFSK